MAGAKNPTLSHLFAALDPVSLILSQFPTQQEKPNLLQLKTERFAMERGPKYNAYARLREAKLRSRSQYLEEPEKSATKTMESKKQGFNGVKRCSVVAQSVPDFSVLVKKENRKPPLKESPMKIPMGLKGSPMGSKGPRLSGIGAKSVNNSGEKRSLRKSYATMEEMKGGGKTVLGYNKY